MSKALELSQVANTLSYNNATGKVQISSEDIPQNLFKTIAVAGQDNVVADGITDTLTLVAGTNMTITTTAGSDTITLASSGSGGTQNLFSTFAVAGQNDIVADSTTDTITFAAGTGITLTTDQATDTLTITGGTATNTFSTIAVATQNNVVADSATDTLTLVAGTNVTITTDDSTDTITFTANDTDTDAFIGLNDTPANFTSAGNKYVTVNPGATGLEFSTLDIVDDTSPQLGGSLSANSFDIDMGTNIITDAKVGQWDTAYGWGNHASAGYTTYSNASVDTHLNQSNPTGGYVLSWSGSDYAWVANAGGGSALTVQEEGVSLATDADTLNFVGTGITASGTGGTKTITVAANAPGGSDTYVQFNDGGTLSGDAGMTYNKTTDALTVGSIISTAAGTPTLTSSSAINLSVGSSVVIQQNSGGGGFRVGNLTTTNRNALTAANGEVIYNTTDNKFQVYENGAWANMVASSGISDVVSDTTPQLGGNLDVNGKDIVSASNGDIEIKPNGSGHIHLETTTGMVRFKHANASGTGIDLGSHNLYLNSDSTTTGTSVSIGLQPGTDTGTTTNSYSFLKTTRTSNTSADFSIHVANENSPGGTYYVTTYYGNDQSGRVDFPGNVKLKSDGTNYASAKVGAANVFNVTAPNQPDHYTFNDPDSHWFPTATDDPTLTLRRGETYYFVMNASGHPLEIRTSAGASAFTEGITNNTTAVGTIIFKVPMVVSDNALVYQCTSHANMLGYISII